MLSGETAKGAYPIQAGGFFFFCLIPELLISMSAVLMMAETCFLAESAIAYGALYDDLRSSTALPTETAETIAVAAVAAAQEQNASAILVLSTSGNSARLVSKYRPNVPIITSGCDV
jgi:pyruvate kinase